MAVGKIIVELEHIKYILQSPRRDAILMTEDLPTQDWQAAGGVLTEQGINVPAHLSARHAYRLIADVNRSVDRSHGDSGHLREVTIDEDRAEEALDAINAALEDLGKLDQPKT